MSAPLWLRGPGVAPWAGARHALVPPPPLLHSCAPPCRPTRRPTTLTGAPPLCPPPSSPLLRYSILKQRLARRLAHEGADASKLDLVAVTKVGAGGLEDRGGRVNAGLCTAMCSRRLRCDAAPPLTNLLSHVHPPSAGRGAHHHQRPGSTSPPSALSTEHSRAWPCTPRCRPRSAPSPATWSTSSPSALSTPRPGPCTPCCRPRSAPSPATWSTSSPRRWTPPRPTTPCSPACRWAPSWVLGAGCWVLLRSRRRRRARARALLTHALVPPPATAPCAPTSPQIHNWAHDLEDENTPSLEFVGVGKSYVVVDGQKTFLDVHKVGGCCMEACSPSSADARSRAGVRRPYSPACSAAPALPANDPTPASPTAVPVPAGARAVPPPAQAAGQGQPGQGRVRGGGHARGHDPGGAARLHAQAPGRPGGQEVRRRSAGCSAGRTLRLLAPRACPAAVPAASPPPSPSPASDRPSTPPPPCNPAA